MCNLGIENAITVDLKVPDKGTGIFTEIVEYFDDASIFEDCLQAQGKWIHSQEVKDVAVSTHSNL